MQIDMARKDNDNTAMKKKILTDDSEVVLRFTAVVHQSVDIVL